MTREHIAGITVTLVLHAGLIAFLVAGPARGNMHREPKREIIQTHLVEALPIKAGRPDGNPKLHSSRRMRPRRSARPRPFRPRRPIQRVHSDKAPEKEIEKQAELERLAEQEMEEEADSRPAPRGMYGDSDKGIDDPCVLGFAKALGAYRASIQKKVSGFRRPSFISPEVAKNLVTKVRVTFDDSGAITAVRTVTGSGNDRFDQAAESFIKRIGSFGKPPRCVMFDVKTGRFKKTRTFSVTMRAR